MTLYAQWTRTLESIYTNSDIPKFENNSPPYKARKNSDVGKAFIAYSINNVVLFFKDSTALACKKTDNFTKIGDDYVFNYIVREKSYNVITYHMTNGKFTYVTYDGKGTDYETLYDIYAPASN